MAYDADGNFYNPYQPGTFEYDYEESQRSQPSVELTPEQNAQEIAARELALQNQLPIDFEVARRYEEEGRTSWMDSIGLTILAVAPLVIPGLGQMVGAAILGGGSVSAGVATAGQMAAAASAATGASVSGAAIAAGIGAATINTGITYAITGDASKALTAGATSFVSGVVGSTAGLTTADALTDANVNASLTKYLSSAVASGTSTAISGGSVEQALTNSFANAAGVGIRDITSSTVGPDVARGLGAATSALIKTGDLETAAQSGLMAGIGSFIKSGSTSADATKATASTATTPATVPDTTTQGSVAETIAQPAVTISDTPELHHGIYYFPMSDGGAAYTDEQGKVHYISAQQFESDKAGEKAQTIVTTSPAGSLGTVNIRGEDYLSGDMNLFGNLPTSVPPRTSSATTAAPSATAPSVTTPNNQLNTVTVNANDYLAGDTNLLGNLPTSPAVVTPAAVIPSNKLDPVVVRANDYLAGDTNLLGTSPSSVAPSTKLDPVTVRANNYLEGDTNLLGAPPTQVPPTTTLSPVTVQANKYLEGDVNLLGTPPASVPAATQTLAPVTVQANKYLEGDTNLYGDPPTPVPQTLDKLTITAKAEPPAAVPLDTKVITATTPITVAAAAPATSSAPPVQNAPPVSAPPAPTTLTQSTQIDATANAAQTPATIPTFRVGDLGKYISPLASYEALVQQMYNTAMDEKIRQQPKADNVDTEYWGYGQQPKPIESMFDSFSYGPEVKAATGGSIAALMAAGGASRTGIGSTTLVPHSGKMRVDFRRGDAVTGPGDGQSDDIPAMLADGEFVFPADVVSALGNGSTKAGSDKLYEMMHAIRARARKAHPKSLPPPAKSPLEYLRGKK
jgi:hypothetical protein